MEKNPLKDYEHQVLVALSDLKNWIYQENVEEVSQDAINDNNNLYSDAKDLSRQTQINDELNSDDVELVEQHPINLDSEWKILEETALKCENCDLCKTRISVVFGSGNRQASLMLVGEAPGRDEDKQGVPFVGRAGQLLTKMLNAIEINYQNVYICNIIKCRPPSNRNPQLDEIQSCFPYLQKQLDLVQPKIVLALGNFASRCLLNTQEGIGKMRGQFYYRNPYEVLVTYHPAALLRNPKLKVLAWDDLKLLKSRLIELNCFPT